jgi:hypothetical protein
MISETRELIRQHYDNKEGMIQLETDIKKAKGKSKKDMLEITRFDEKIKLKELLNTWIFTRHSSMFFKYIELLFYMIISNTDQIIYFCMFWSMFETAGIITILYPFALFGYALLEETRPRKEFWTFIRIYTTVILFIKFTFNLGEFDKLAKS